MNARHISKSDRDSLNKNVYLTKSHLQCLNNNLKSYVQFPMSQNLGKVVNKVSDNIQNEAYIKDSGLDNHKGLRDNQESGPG